MTEVVVDASPLIVLTRAGHLDLLQDFGEGRVLVPKAVATEVSAHSDDAAKALKNLAWLLTVEVGPVPENIVAWGLGAGESSVLTWAALHLGTVAVLDDFAARRCAKVMGLRLIGTLGLALRAKRIGSIAAARPVVNDLQSSGLYLSDEVVSDALSLVGE